MANIKSAKKDVRRIIKKTAFNNSMEAKCRTLLKKAKEAIEIANKYGDALSQISAYQSFADKLARKHIISQASASRHTKNLVKALKLKFSNQEEQVA